MKARVIGALWRAFRPGSVGQKVVRALVIVIIGTIIIAACSLVAITL